MNFLQDSALLDFKCQELLPSELAWIFDIQVSSFLVNYQRVLKDTYRKMQTLKSHTFKQLLDLGELESQLIQK